jgi:hypothetical protein
MAYLTAADFHPDTLNEACQGYALGDVDAAKITSAIARLSQRLDDYTNDHFESEAALVLEIDGTGSPRLYLPKRCTAVTSVKLRDETGTLGSAQAATAYRLRSSLYATGSKRLDTRQLDWLDLVPYSGGLVSVPSGTDGYCWPAGPQTVQVTGTFGWTTCPSDIKVALAQMVWDHFTAQGGALGRTEQLTANGETFSFVATDPEAGFFTGLRDVDAIINNYRRSYPVLVG